MRSDCCTKPAVDRIIDNIVEIYWDIIVERLFPEWNDLCKFADAQEKLPCNGINQTLIWFALQLIWVATQA